MRDHKRIRHGDKTASRLAPKGDDGRFDLYVVMNLGNPGSAYLRISWVR
jgi:hypothetical protein